MTNQKCPYCGQKLEQDKKIKSRIVYRCKKCNYLESIPLDYWDEE